MQITPPALRRAVRDAVINPDQAAELAPYLDAAAPTPPRKRETALDALRLIVGFFGIALAGVLTLTIIGSALSLLLAAIALAWRAITGS